MKQDNAFDELFKQRNKTSNIPNQIVDRIKHLMQLHDIKDHKELAVLIGKPSLDIIKWMTNPGELDMRTIASLEVLFEEKIVNYNI